MVSAAGAKDVCQNSSIDTCRSNSCQAPSISMAIESELLFCHADPIMLSDFCQNYFDDYEKSFFRDSTLNTMIDAGLSDNGFFQPLCFSESNNGSSFRKVACAEKLVNFQSNEGSSLKSLANIKVPCSLINGASLDAVDYDKQSMDLKQINVDPYILTDELSSLVSNVKQHTSIDMSGVTVADDALNCLPSEEFKQQQSEARHGFEKSGNDSLQCIVEKLYYPLPPDFSSQIYREVPFSSPSVGSSAFQIRTTHPSLSLIPEYPESLSNSSLACVVHTSTSSAGSTSPCAAYRDTRHSTATETDGRMVFCQEMQSGRFKLMPKLGERLTAAAAGLADQKLNSESSPKGDCFRSALACNIPYTLQSRLIQRSLSSHSLGQLRTTDLSTTGEGALYTDTVPSDSNTMLSSKSESCNPLEAEENAGMGGLRRVYSTGDIQNFGGKQTVSSAMNSYESHLTKNRQTRSQIGRYTIEERQNRIDRYRQKRTERNFHKKIKYACRKTLADSRPRVRGRFARNEESSELQETNLHTECEEDDELYGVSFQGIG